MKFLWFCFESYIKISVVSGCSLKYLGDLPFEFKDGTCDTFNLNDVPRIFLCFSRGNTGNIGDFTTQSPEEQEIQTCRMLSRTNDGLLSDIELFNFDKEFVLDLLPNSIYTHHFATIANYKGKHFNN